MLGELLKLALLMSICCLGYVPMKANPIDGLLKRLGYQLPGKFKVEVEDKGDGKDFFELTGGGKWVKVKANNYVNVACGVNWYLKYYCHCNFSFCEDQVSVPEILPEVNERKETPLKVNFYMNYCTFSYTTAFWDWKRWEREIDLMALNGVTMPMAMVGAEVVWKNTLEKFGYSEEEINEFLCGPGYFGWLLMGNLEKIGGPLPKEWFEQQTVLQKKIVARMKEYGMKPVFQGFFGMVPASLQKKFPHARFIQQGKWNSLNRPPVLVPSDPLFSRMAGVWYREYEKLFGTADFYGGDLFHEGGRTDGVDVTEAARDVQKAMLAYNPRAVWVLQAWGGNPKPILLNGLKKENTFIVDICAEFWTNWKSRKGFEGFPWIWSHLTNYGGNIGLHGRLDAIAEGVVEARNDKDASVCMQGIGATPEGIEVNPVVFDLANEMRWRKERLDVDTWLKEYTVRRYGIVEKNVQEAWGIFHSTVYGSFEGHRRPSESVFCALPSLKGERITASAWSQCRIFYDPARFAQGVELFLKSADDLGMKATYQYDAVDFVRQYIADLGRESYYEWVKAYGNRDQEQFKYWSKRFLELMQDQDMLLSCHIRFGVGRWLDMARKKSRKKDIQDLYEYNARLLIGTWTENRSEVRDYAHKEWGGMLRDYYLPRWSAYIAFLDAQLEGRSVVVPDSFEAERNWIKRHDRYELSGADPVKTAKRLFEKYYTK